MTPSARFKSLVNLFDHLLENQTPADHGLSYFFKNNRYAGSGDKRFIKDHLYGLFRHYYRLNLLLKAMHLPQDAFHQSFLYLGLQSVITHENFETFFSAPHGFQTIPPSVYDLLKRIKTADLELLENESLECPQWLAPFMTFSMMEKPGPTVRVNTLKTNRDDLLALFKKEGMKAKPTPHSPFGIHIIDAPLLEHTKAFKDGLFDIQDEGSQLLALLCDVKESDKVLDYCAGACGKTLALAMLMNNKGRIIASDIDEKRLMRGALRLKRAGVCNTQLKALNDENKGYFKSHKNFFDIVLVDAPCSGTGTWRRNPEARLYLTPQRLDELQSIGRDILSKTSALVAPGGKLVYATCSLLPQENEEQVAWFLANHPQFEEGEKTLKLSPETHNTDGFFGCVLVKKH